MPCPDADRPPRSILLDAFIGLLLLAALVIVVKSTDRGSWPDSWTLVVESALEDSVLVDVRMSTPAGNVEGPVAQGLLPGTELNFPVSSDRAVCLRIFVPPDNRMLPLRVEGSGSGARTSIRLRPSNLTGPAPAPIRCNPELAQHRVRPTLGRYFDPDRPHIVHRERILSSDRW